jgi:hypothetical protein
VCRKETVMPFYKSREDITIGICILLEESLARCLWMRGSPDVVHRVVCCRSRGIALHPVHPPYGPCSEYAADVFVIVCVGPADQSIGAIAWNEASPVIMSPMSPFSLSWTYTRYGVLFYPSWYSGHRWDSCIEVCNQGLRRLRSLNPCHASGQPLLVQMPPCSHGNMHACFRRDTELGRRFYFIDREKISRLAINRIIGFIGILSAIDNFFLQI